MLSSANLAKPALVAGKVAAFCIITLQLKQIPLHLLPKSPEMEIKGEMKAMKVCVLSPCR